MQSHSKECHVRPTGFSIHSSLKVTLRVGVHRYHLAFPLVAGHLSLHIHHQVVEVKCFQVVLPIWPEILVRAEPQEQVLELL